MRGRARNRQRRRPTSPGRPDEDVEIRSLGALGDGEGTLADGAKVYVPFTLTGDHVRVRIGAKRGDGFAGLGVEDLSVTRHRSPDCEYFRTCGGCQVQHVPAEDYAAWKREMVVTALSRHGLKVDIEPLRQMPFGARRRATFRALRTAAGTVLGFNAAESDRVVNIDDCPALVEPLRRLIGPLKNLVGGILATGERSSLAVTHVETTGAEILFRADAEPDLEGREAIAAFADANDVARVGWQIGEVPPEPIVQRRAMAACFGGLQVELPWHAFLQPSQAGEALLQEVVTAAAAGAGTGLDLFCGVGTFALPMQAAGMQVTAVDNDDTQVQALTAAANRAGVADRVSVASRNLFADPIPGNAISAFDAVVFDPPRAGARAQASEIADSTVATVIAVSCNPATLARDLRILADGGYRVERVMPLDQFPMTHHVEAVAVLRRSGT